MKYLFTIIVFLLVRVTYSQGDLYVDGHKYNRNEKSFGVVMVSNGFGFNYKIGRRLDGRKKLLYEVDALWFKHPKEIRIKTYDSGNRFVYGKVNFPLNFRFTIGRQKVLYEKKDRNGVTISYFFNGGVSVVLLKPVYYNIISDGILTEQQFDLTEIHTHSQIHSRSSFFNGFSESTLVPGISLKAGFDFDFASSDDRIHAIDAGASLDAYFKEIEIMATESKQMFLFTLFVTYRFGQTTKTKFN